MGTKTQDAAGSKDLDVKDFLKKYGAMNSTSQCCATGTCDNITQDVELDNQAKRTITQDKTSPSKLADKFGPPKR